MKALQHIFEFPFVKELQDKGAEIFIVGGSVRDAYLGKEPKDIDIIVRLLPFNDLIALLESHGKVDLVGESFGVIKFTFKGEIYDIAIPRIDKKIAGATGHKSIEAQSDHTLELIDDLGRRDFTFNALALDRDMKVIDEFGGLEDLAQGIVRCVSKEAFAEDPLRMLRAIQFSARFGFLPDDETLVLIQQNADLIEDISKERVLDEFKKVFEKGGDVDLFGNLLFFSKLYFALFKTIMNVQRIEHAQTLSEFLFFSIAHAESNVADFFKYALKVDNDTYKELQSLDIIYNTFKVIEAGKTMHHCVFDSLRKSDIALRSEYIADSFKTPFLLGIFPKSMSELALSGEDFMELGMKGKEIGDAQKKCIDAIFHMRLKNEREELLTLFN